MDVRFEVLKEIAEEKRCSTVEDLQFYTGCASQCGLCSPYIRQMLRTGQTAFEVVWSQTLS